MYTGNNKTALCSQRNIADAFIQLLRENNYGSISVSKICKAAQVSRQTFYSLFESKENIIIYELSKKHGFQPGETCDNAALNLEELSSEYSDYIFDKKEFLSLLVDNDIMYLMHECLFDSFLGCSCFEPDRSREYREFLAEFFAGGLCGIAKIFILQGCSLSSERLHDMIYDLFSGNYLLNY
ncbi:MAG: TetR/AcrR family transcriptional regulator [Eubacterium sp.]|nr:TetR/AcrR family transcriptional regulator [Eubacterium sp.]